VNEIRTPVHIIAIHNGVKYWLHAVTTKHTNRGSYLDGDWREDASQSTPWAAGFAEIIRRRLREESGVATRISLTKGDAAELVEEGEQL